MVNTDISAEDNYPSGYRKANYSGVAFCRVNVDDDDVQVCSSAIFSTNGKSYQNVCDIARGLSKKYITTAFYDSVLPSSSMTLPAL